MRDQKLEHWLKVDRGDFQPYMQCDIKNEKLREPVAAFNDNVWRALHLSTFPFGMVMLGERLTLAHLAARQERLGDPCLVGFRQLSPDEFKDITQLSRDIVAGKKPTNVGFGMNLIFLQDLVSFVADKEMRTYDTLMESQLVLCWTAFETLVGDLWRESVNSKPQYLAGLTGTANRIQKLVGLEPKRQQYEKKPIESDLATLEDDNPCEVLSKRAVTLGMMCKATKGSYNLSDKMGTLLIEAERVQFTSLEAIREAYSLAFSENVRRARTDDIEKALASRELDALSACS